MLTGRGVAIVSASLAAYAAAALWHYDAGGAFAATGIAATLLGWLWVAPRLNLRAARSIPNVRVKRGDEAFAIMSVRNLSRIPAPSTAAFEPCGTERVPIAIPALRSRVTSTTTYRLPTARRGVYEVGPLVVGRSDPFGLWRSERETGSTDRFYVHPRTHVLAGLPIGLTRSLDGLDTDRLPSGTITFHTLREYVIGDDLRHVHWRSSAHLGTLLVREQVDTSVSQLTLVVDTCARHHSEVGFEEAVEVAASVAVLATAVGNPVQIVTSSGRSAGGTGLISDTNALLDLLAGVALDDASSMPRTVSVLGTRRRGDILVVVSGAPDEESSRALDSLTRRFGASIVAFVGAPTDTLGSLTQRGATILRAETASEFALAWNKLVTRR